jgi:hypothetical protein
MRYKKIILALACITSPLYAENDRQLQQEIRQLQQQTKVLQAQLNRLQHRLVTQEKNKQPNSSQQTKRTPITQKQRIVMHRVKRLPATRHSQKKRGTLLETHLTAYTPNKANPESFGFYPTALVAKDKILTYIAGTPVVSAPYLGDRPAFDGSDYIVNISSINRDIRLMQQRRRLYRAYSQLGYPTPEVPILAFSGKVEPIASINSPYNGNTNGDLTLGSGELDLAASINKYVEAYMSIAYDESPPDVGPRVTNSAFNLNMGFVNIGNLDRTPFYFTAGQLFVPFGRYSSAMISAPLPMNLARTKSRPVIFGYKSQKDTGVFAAVYGFRSDTTLGRSGIGGANLGYIFGLNGVTGEVGASYISSIDDAAGMQTTGSQVGTTFGGFGSFANGNEDVRKTQAFGAHTTISYERFNLALEWITATEAFRTQDLSFNGYGAKPTAGQAELGMTFKLFDRPASLGAGYQWTTQALALNLPQQRYIGVFNISIWKDTVESLEYRHDIDYSVYTYANGAAPIGGYNQNTLGTGRSSDTVSAQIGVYF